MIQLLNWRFKKIWKKIPKAHMHTIHLESVIGAEVEDGYKVQYLTNSLHGYIRQENYSA